jgi:SAM-dependent methyltransferase
MTPATGITLAVVVERGWEWDETLYAGAAAYYRRGRLPYPVGVVRAVREALGLDGAGRLLDIGCGPGSFTLVVAPLFDQVVGIDADADMIAAAAEAGRRAGVANVVWRQLRAEQLPADLGRFRVVTLAQSFHWLNRPRVAAAVHGMLQAGGACVHVQATTHRGVDGPEPMPHPGPPRAAIETLIRSYLGSLRRAGRSVLPQGTPSDEDDIVASVFSLSSAAPHLFGARLVDFEADLRALLRGTSPAGRFSEQMREVALDIWRPRSTR